MHAIFVLVTAVFAFGLAGCAKQSPTPAPHPNSSLVVNMEAIPGYIAAMPMSYPGHDSGALAALHGGDAITADVVVARDGAYLETVHVVQEGPSKGL